MLKKHKKVHFPDYLKYTCINAAYSDFINKFVRAIDSVAPVKQGRVRANSKPWFDSKIISAIRKRGNLYSRYKKSGLEIDKDKFKTSKKIPQKMLNRKRRVEKFKAKLQKLSSKLQKPERVAENFKVSCF